jgi:hypothetical protein
VYIYVNPGTKNIEGLWPWFPIHPLISTLIRKCDT